MESTMQPVSAKYSLGTSFSLNSDLDDLLEARDFDGLFVKGDTVFGVLSWKGGIDQSSNYKLEIEKVLACASDSEGFVPLFDPDGSEFHKGPQFGCIKPHKLIAIRKLILDRSSVEEFASTELLSAKFLSSELEKNTVLKEAQVHDGFKFSAEALLGPWNMTGSEERTERTWYLQVMFSIDSRTPRTHKRHTSSVYSLSRVFNNGTNIQPIRVSHKRRASLNRGRQKLIQAKNGNLVGEVHYMQVDSVFKFKDILLRYMLPIFGFIILSLLTVITSIYVRKQSLQKSLAAKNFAQKSNLNPDDQQNSFSRLKAFLLMGKGPVDGVPSGMSSTTGTIAATPLLNKKQINLNHSSHPMVVKMNGFNEDSNCTLQTLISANSSHHNAQALARQLKYQKLRYQNVKQSESNLESEEKQNESRDLASVCSDEDDNKEMHDAAKANVFKTFLSKISSGAILSRRASRKENSKDQPNGSIDANSSEVTPSRLSHKNNYLYFNYNNSKMQYFTAEESPGEVALVDDSTMDETAGIGSASVVSGPASGQATPIHKCIITTKMKRLSGTEV